MANNAALTKDILALAPDTVVEGKTNKDLVKILKGLRANATPPAADETTPPTASETTLPTPDETTPHAPSEDDEAIQKKIDDEAAQKKIDAKKKAKNKLDDEKKAIQDAIPPYRVADGRSLTSKKGVLNEGAEVKAEYLPGGQKTLDDNVDRGFVIKK